jgi:single-stranded-DNA-specific exonuclease
MLYKTLKNKLDAQASNICSKKITELYPPSTMLNLEKAGKLLASLLKEGKRTLIVGDYDADGMMATTVLIRFLRDVGFTEEIVDYIIPSRLKDGYGLSSNIIEYALEKEFEVIVTVDNGIAAVEAIKLAKDNGLTVIVTDHHTAPAILPPADIIVCPKQPGETFPFIDISGATVAWYLAYVLRGEFDSQIDMRKYLDYVGITVVSDVMPLNDINIGILNYALKKIKNRERHIYRLIWNDWTAPVIDTTSLSFNLVPLINAIGRINDANIGVKMFLSTDQNEIVEIFSYVQKINEDRKELSRNGTLQSEVDVALDTEVDSSGAAIVVRGEFHEGIVGIIAGRLAEKYQKPAYVFSWNEKKQLWKGSARTYGNVNLYELTVSVSEYVAFFGGHKGAAGLAVSEENFENFAKLLSKKASELDKDLFLNLDLVPVDCKLSEVSIDILNLMEEYAPFGEGNLAPVFKTKSLVKVKKVLKGGLHYLCDLIDENGNSVEGLFFNIDSSEEFLKLIENEVNYTFSLSKTYNLHSDTYGFQLICNLV